MHTEKHVKPGLHKPDPGKILGKVKEILHIKHLPGTAKDPENKNDGSHRHG